MLAQKVVALAEEHCDGKIVFVLEGGYDPMNVANGAGTVFDALRKRGLSHAAHDPNPHKEPDCESRIEEVRKWHGFTYVIFYNCCIQSLRSMHGT